MLYLLSTIFFDDGIQRDGGADADVFCWGTHFKNICFISSLFLQTQKSNVPSVQSTIYLT